MLQHNTNIIKTHKLKNYPIISKLDIYQSQQRIDQMIVLYNF